MIACMGGWCASRDKCANYYAETKLISERLCGDEEEEWTPIYTVIRVKTDELKFKEIEA